MNKLFDRKDMLTIATADQAVIGAKGFFGNGLCTLTESIKQGDVKTLFDVNTSETSCFEDSDEKYYLFFLPLDKVNYIEPTYRALENIDELFHFLKPEYFNADYICNEDGKSVKFNQDEKAKFLLGKKITLRNKRNGRIKVMVTQDVEFSSDISDSSNTYLNCLELKYLFENYEILIDGKWVPFGIED